MVGDKLNWNGWQLTVVAVAERRVRQVRLRQAATLTQQVLDALKHQHHHSQPDRDIGQPLVGGDAFTSISATATSNTGST